MGLEPTSAASSSSLSGSVHTSISARADDPASSTGLSTGSYTGIDPNKIKTQIRIIGLAGDFQIHSPEFKDGVTNSLQINRWAPARRPDGTMLSTPALSEDLIRHTLDGLPKAWFQGVIYTGDFGDISSTEELDAFYKMCDRLVAENPMARSLAVMVGNHDIVHFGSFSDGNQMGGAIGLGLSLQGRNRDYAKDVYLPSVGSEDRKMDKHKLVDSIYQRALKQKRAPVVLDSVNPYRYQLSGYEDHPWKDSAQVVSDFWRPQGPGRWNLNIQYEMEDEDLRPEQKEVYASAFLMERLKTSKGSLPVYFINMDTMDYLEASTSAGAVQGHVSWIQVRAIRALMAELKNKDPNAKFVLGGHYPITSLTDAVDNGLNKILDDEAVIACIGAHTHDRGYVNLASETYKDKLELSRLSPLPQITIPATVEYPNEIALLTYGITENRPDTLFFQVEFKGVDKKRLPGAQAKPVQRAVDSIKKDLLPYPKALTLTTDERLQRMGLPGKDMPFLWSLHSLANLDTGIITDRERIADLTIAKGVIPLSVVGHRLTLLLSGRIAALNLIEAGFEKEGAELMEIYQKAIDHLFNFYATCLKHHLHHVMTTREVLDKLDQHTQELEAISQKVYGVAKKEIDNGNDSKGLLQSIERILVYMPRAIDSYKHWIYQTHVNHRTKRPPSEMANDATLRADPYFREMLIQDIWNKLPYDSYSRAFLTLIHLESARRENIFYGGTRNERIPEEFREFKEILGVFGLVIDLGKEVTGLRLAPDKIRLEINTQTGKATHLTQPLPIMTEWEKAVYTKKMWGHEEELELPADYLEMRERLAREPENNIEDHWLFKVGPNIGAGTSLVRQRDGTLIPKSGINYGLDINFGGRWHLRNYPKKMRINTSLSLMADARFQYRELTLHEDGEKKVIPDFHLSFLGQNAWTIGDPLGLVEVGPAVMAGVSFRHLMDPDLSFRTVPAFGVAGQLNLLESITLELGKYYYFEPHYTDTEFIFRMVADIPGVITRLSKLFGVRSGIWDARD